MKTKKPLSMFLIVMFILSATLIATNVPSAAASPSWGEVYFDPGDAIEYFTTANLSCTEDFNVTLKITNVTQWTGWAIRILYNTTLLDAVDITVHPDAGNKAPIDPDTYEWIPINDTLGEVFFGFGFDLPGKTGDFDVAEIQFHITYAPPRETVMAPENRSVSCDFHLQNVSIVDAGANEMKDHYDLVDGFYEYKRPQIVAGAPTAIITYLPVVVYVGDTVTVDGSSSLTGDSTITSWDWDLTGNGTWITANGASTRQFDCNGTGIVSVTLNITNTLPMSDDETVDIDQKLLLGAFFDLYTSENRFCNQTTTFLGEGPDEPCDALSPDVNVTLFVEALWNGKPVMHVLVAFVVLDHEGACVLYRTAETDKDGIARVWFRVPTPCTGQMFGKWIAYASGKIQEVKHEDTMPFDVGYAVTLVGPPITTDGYGEPKSDFLAPCEDLGVKVHVKNIMMIPKELTLIFVVYDDCDVPIGQVIFNTTIAPGVFCTPHEEDYDLLSIHLPQWTYVGTGKVYVSAFTALPQECGVAYCPEISTEFGISWSGEA